MSRRRVVLDTNVVVSALLNSFGAPCRVLNLVLAGELTVIHDDRVLDGLRRVLAREKFGFSAADIEALLGFVKEEGLDATPSPLGIDLSDPDDLPFLEVGHSAGPPLLPGTRNTTRRRRGTASWFWTRQQQVGRKHHYYTKGEYERNAKRAGMRGPMALSRCFSS